MEDHDEERSSSPEENISTVKEVFIECQETNKTENFIVALGKLFEESDEDEFFEEFRTLLMHVLIHVGAETPVNRIFKIVTGFVLRLDKEHSKIAEEEDEDATLHPFVEKMLDFLLEMQDAAYHAVRIRSLQLMSILFKDLNELPNDGAFWESLYEMASSRLYDTSATVRAKAVLTFCYLQDPSSKNCPIIKEFLFLMVRDPNFHVRRNIASSIAVTSQTLSALQSRLRDINSGVRKTALLRISEKVSVNCFSPAQRIEILSSCVNDVSSDVKLAAKQHLIPAWLRMCENDIIKFLNLVDIQAIPEVMQKVLNKIFETRDVQNIAASVEIDPESHLISVEQLTVPQAFLWRCLCQFVKTMNAPFAADFFDEITPTISAFCAYLEVFLNTMETVESSESKKKRCFIFHQILSIAAELDFSDTVGEKILHALVIEILKSKTCTLEMVKPLVICMKSMELNHRIFLQEIMDFVSELHKPVLMDDPDVKDPENFILIQKVMQILVEAWKCPRPEGIFLEMSEMKDNIIMPMLMHENHHIRRIAVEALGLYSMFSVEEARLNYSRFMEAVIFGQLDVQIIALKVAFDILMIFGYSLIADIEKIKGNLSAEDPDEPVSETQKFAFYVEKLMPLLDSEVKDIVHVVAEGLAKVLISRRIPSLNLFFKLCSMRYDRANEDDAKLKICIAAFMSKYAASEGLTPGCLKETVSRVLDTIIDAPEGSELARVDGIFLLKMLIKLVFLMPRPEYESETQGSPIHDDIALMVCNKILEDPEADFVPPLVKIFDLFETTPLVSKELVDAVKRVQDVLENRKLLKIVNTFFIRLSDDNIDKDESSLAPRQLSFSQVSSHSTTKPSSGSPPASPGTPPVSSDTPLIEDVLSDSDSIVDIAIDESDSDSERDIESDLGVAELSPTAPSTELNKNDSIEEIIIPESPEYQRGDSPTIEKQLDESCEFNESVLNMKNYELNSLQYKQRRSYPSESIEYKVKLESHQFKQRKSCEPGLLKQELIDENCEQLSPARVKKSCGNGDQLEKFCDDESFIYGS